MEKSEKVEAYFSEEHLFKKELTVLRDLALKTNLEETFKWNFPTYTLKGKNVIALCKFKHHFGIWFFNGVFLNDFKNVLENAQEGKTLAMRHWKFKTTDEIDSKTVTAYINEAIENQRKGLRLIPKKKEKIKINIPISLQEIFDRDNTIKIGFNTLTPSQKKEYTVYISAAKREKTRANRLAKILPLIKEGQSLNAKYKK